MSIIDITTTGRKVSEAADVQSATERQQNEDQLFTPEQLEAIVSGVIDKMVTGVAIEVAAQETVEALGQPSQKEGGQTFEEWKAAKVPLAEAAGLGTIKKSTRRKRVDAERPVAKDAPRPVEPITVSGDTMVGNIRDRRQPGFDPSQKVRIDRGAKWGNPFRFKEDSERPKVIAQYEDHLRRQLASGRISRADLQSLAGKLLLCWCDPLPCHGEVLALYADASMDDEAWRALGANRRSIAREDLYLDYEMEEELFREERAEAASWLDDEQAEPLPTRKATVVDNGVNYEARIDRFRGEDGRFVSEDVFPQQEGVLRRVSFAPEELSNISEIKDDFDILEDLELLAETLEAPKSKADRPPAPVGEESASQPPKKEEGEYYDKSAANAAAMVRTMDTSGLEHADDEVVEMLARLNYRQVSGIKWTKRDLRFLRKIPPSAKKAETKAVPTMKSASEPMQKPIVKMASATPFDLAAKAFARLYNASVLNDEDTTLGELVDRLASQGHEKEKGVSYNGSDLLDRAIELEYIA